MNINYRLRTSDRKAKDGVIWCDFSFEGSRLRTSTQLKVPVSQWSTKKMIVHQSHDDSLKINERLRQVTDIIIKLVAEVQRQELIVTEKGKSRI